MPSSIVASIAVTAILATKAIAVSNGLAITPQMGWNNWNAFGCKVSETLILETAQKIVDFGLRDLGYHYVILDDCWSAGRDSNGSLVANATRFPNGMAHVADRVHALGLGFGMYSDAGSMTCAQYVGSLGHEVQDAQTFASWGVDYLKYDNCFNDGQSGTPLITYNRYKKMGDALNSTGRPILYSLCNWGEDYPWKWAQTIANSWRMSGDITDSFNRADARCPCTGDQGYDCALPGFHCSAMNILNKVSSFVDKGIKGAWNDLDMLEVGNGGMSDVEYVAHFSMWAAVKSPLIMGNDVRKLHGASLSILSNPAVIAVSQDPLGQSAVRRWRHSIGEHGGIQMWSGALSGGDYVVILLNVSEMDLDMNATLTDIFWDEGPGGTAAEIHSTWEAYDLWGNRMDAAEAELIVQGHMEMGHSDAHYNATEKSYAQGLAERDPKLLGKLTTTVLPGGALKAPVARHGVRMFRLRKYRAD